MAKKLTAETLTDAPIFDKQIPPFQNFLRDKGTDDSDIPDYVREKIKFLKEMIIGPDGLTWWNWMTGELDRMSQQETETENPAYPDQGLRETGYEGHRKKLPPLVNHPAQPLPDLKTDRYTPEYVERTIHAWLYYLELFNHPARLAELYKQSEIPFASPTRKFSRIFLWAWLMRQSITIRDLALSVQGAEADRASRTERLQNGPFINYGREVVKGFFHQTQKRIGHWQARSFILSGSNPDVDGTGFSLSTISQAHSIANIPRDGDFANLDQQADLAKKAREWNEHSPILIGKPEAEKQKLLDFYNHNLSGTIEASPDKALLRAKKLYEVGIRTFRIYSPEPGNGPLEALKALRQLEKEQHWEPIEIFVGQVVSVEQAIDLQAAGADAIYLGIGGGGRCITGIVGNLTIDWPQLLWQLRGRVKIPIFVEGGGSDAIGVTLVLGASGIGATGKLAGNIENPGGYLVFIDDDGKPFVYYGGEAADRMRKQAERDAAFGEVRFTEGETRKVYILDNPGQLPTLMRMILHLHEGAIGAMVFQNATGIKGLWQKGVRALRRESPNGQDMKGTH